MSETSLHQSEPVMLPGRSFGRMARSIAGYSLVTALMIASGLPIFIPAVLIHCAISYGRRATWISLAIASVLAFGAISLSPATDATKLVVSFVTWVIVAVALPAMLVLPMIERGEAFGRVLMFLLIVSALGLALTEIGTREIASFSPYALHVAQAKSTSAEFVERYRATGMPADAVKLVERWGTYYSSVLLPAGLLVSAAISFVLSLLMIGRLRAWREFAAHRKIAATSPYLFRNFSLPDWVVFAFILGGLAPLAKGMLQTIAANMLMLAVFLYILQGFALLRFLLSTVNVGFVGALFAFGFAFITGIGPLLLGVAGLFDPFFDFRHFKKRKDDSHESHSD